MYTTPASARALRVVLLCLLCVLLSPAGGNALPLSPGPASGGLPIAAGDSWRYFKGTSEPPASWPTVAFDDSSWTLGLSGFGFGGWDDATILTDMQAPAQPSGYVAVYVRRLFTVPNPAAVTSLTLSVKYNDGFVAYINGTEVARGNMTGTPPPYTSPATGTHDATTAEVIDLTASVGLLVAGTNVLAIQGHNVSVSDADLSLIPELSVGNAPNQPAAPASPSDGAPGESMPPSLCVDVTDPNGDPLTVTFKGRLLGAPSPQDFSIIALPDTQYYAQSHADIFNAQMNWIVSNRPAGNIAFVTELGDCVQDGNSIPGQWATASTAYGLLEDSGTTGLPDGIPFGIAVGNHDQTPNGTPRAGSDEGATTLLFNQTFGRDRFCPVNQSCRDYFGENYTFGGGYPNNMDNHYELFSASGMDFIVFHLEFDPSNNATRQAVLAWMDNILTNVYPTRRAIVTAHYLLDPSGSFGNQGQAVYDTIKNNPNAFLMLNGHLDQANNRTDSFAGGTIHSMVSDYQTRPNGGNGWLRILTFSPRNNSIRVQTYSPYLSRFIDNHADNTAGTAKNELTLDYAMDVPFQTIGTANVASGGQACVSWAGLQSGKPYEWQVEVSDGTSTTRGPLWDFRTGCSNAADCDDGAVCTADSCQNNVCANTPIANCCTTAVDCDDQDTCTVDACNTGTHACDHPVISCSDGNACTTDQCTGGACSHGYAPTPACCANSAQCDDGNPGTIDLCSGGSCSNTATGGCASNAECNDGNACTNDACASSATANTAALSFNGSSQYVRTADAAPELGTPTFTVEAWIKWDGTTGAGTGTGAGGLSSVIPLVAKGRAEQDASAVDTNYYFGIDAASKKLAADFEEAMGTCNGGTNPGAPCSYRCSTTTATVCAQDSQCPAGETCSTVNGCTGGGTCDGRAGLNHPIIGKTAFSTTPTAPWVAGWNHVAVSYDGACWTLYVNGIDDTETTGPPMCPGVTPRSDNISPLGIASAFTSGGTAAGFFGGQMDEVRIWNYARSQAQIQATKNQQVGTGSGLLGAWAFNEGAGTSAADTAGTNNQGTLTGSPAWITGAANLVDLGPTFCVNTALDCSDGNPCTLDICTNGSCANPPGDDGISCSDGNACTQLDACAGGSCAGVSQPNGTGCDDGISCTVNDQCTNGTCAGAPAGTCDDGNACTADTCAGVPPSQTALSFDGTDDHVTFGNLAKLGLSQFTIETWFNRTGTGVSNTTGTGGVLTMLPLVTKGAPEADGSNVDANYILGINTTGNVLAADFEDTATGLNHPISGTTAILNNTWYHAAATYDGTTWRLYLNGNLEATLAVGAFAPRFDSIQRAGLGAMLTSTGTRLGAFQGVLDEPRIWNYARSLAEIQNGRLRQITSMTGLVARWGLNDGSGTTAADSTVPAGNGTLTNVAIPANAWVAGAPSLSAVMCSYSVLPNGTTCTDEGNPCTTDTCTSGVCGHAAGNNGAACTDANACTAPDTCGGGVCTGSYAPVAGCCTTNGQCNDGNSATTDTCSGGSCNNILPTICTVTSECNDNNVCTADSCAGNASSLNFDGSNDYVTMLSSAGEAALGARAFTLEAWVRRDGASWGTTASTGTGGVTAVPLVTKGRGEAEGTNVDCNYFLGITATGQLAADFEQFADGGGWTAGQNHPACGSATITDQAWHHVAVTYSTTTGWSFYVDGVEGTTATASSCTTCNPVGSCPQNPGVEPRYDSTQYFGLGTAMTSNGTAAGFFGGLMDEARVWNRVLSVAELQAGKNLELTSGTGLIGRWGLNENGGATAADSTTPAQNGTLTNGPVFSPTDKAPVGMCLRTPIANCCTTTAQCDDGNPCTNDACTGNTCTHTNNTSSCNDGNACTYGDVCGGGTCGGTAITCTSDACNTRTCNGTSTCTVTPLSGNSCNDGNFCTSGDICGGGTCVGTTPVICNDTNVCTDDTCTPETGCIYTNNTSVCDDASACTSGDICGGGTCAGTTPVICNDNNVCTDDTCTPETGCVYTDNTAACDDGSACTSGDICGGGTCAGTPILCNDNNVCTDDTCNPETGCIYTNNTAACDDASACTSGDICGGGTCAGTTPVICNDNNVCTDDTCTPETGCVYTDNTAACDDGSACTSGDICGGGTCAGTPILCNDNNVCTDDTCNPETGCVYTNNTAACDDGSACTSGDVCGGGACTGTPVICNDNNVCTDDTCNPETGCIYTNNTAACDDASACTSGDVCGGGTCAGTPVICNDNNVCTDDTCNPETGCVYTNNTAACDDASACTSGDVCGGGACAGTPVICNDNNVCTDDTCNPETGCIYTNNTAACDDASACTSGDICGGGTCAGTPILCNDNNVCTDDTCNPETGCIYTNNTAACDDASACTSGDVCGGGTCAGTPVICNDNNVCTDDTCNPETGCIYTNNTAACDDGSACTYDDVCTGGSCGGTSITCTSDACNTRACNGTSACAETPLTGNACDDGNGCTQDICASGVCIGVPNPPPGAVLNSVLLDRIPTDTTITWSDPPGPYNVYRGEYDPSGSWQYNHACLAIALVDGSAEDTDTPPEGHLFYYVISRANACAESSLGTDSSGQERPNPNACTPPAP